MNNNLSRIGVLTFFAAVLVISTVLLLTKKEEPESIETMNTLPQEYRTETAAITSEPEEEETDETEPSYGRDLEIATAPILTKNEAEEERSEPSETASYAAGTEAPPEQTAAPQTSRTVITSRQRKEYDSNSVYIDMENILQNPELPVGCEITALTILLRYYGFNAEKTDMARNYLPTSWGNPQTIDGKLHKDSFYNYFIGDPFSQGYGCFSPAIERAANSYISSHGGGYTVKNISGCHPDTLYEYLIKDIPVLCWATDGMIEPEYYETWYDNATGQQLDWYLNEHCFVLAGFNIANSTVTLNDPMKGIIDYNIDRFEVRFKQMNSQAIVLIPNGAAETEAVTETAAVTDETAETAVTSEENGTDNSETAVPESVWETGSDTETETAAASETETEYETSETEVQTADTSDTTVFYDPYVTFSNTDDFYAEGIQ